VVLFILLCGYEPFWDEAGEIGVTRKIVCGDYEFESPYWDDISMPAKDFVKQLMMVDPSKRPTAREALLNPWVQGNVASDVPLVGAQQRIRDFNARRKFKAAVKATMAVSDLAKMAQSQSPTSENK